MRFFAIKRLLDIAAIHSLQRKPSGLILLLCEQREDVCFQTFFRYSTIYQYKD